jgi:hypothetical protein
MMITELVQNTDRPAYFPFPPESVSTPDPVIDNLISWKREHRPHCLMLSVTFPTRMCALIS